MAWGRRRWRVAVLLVATGCMSTGGSGSCDPSAIGEAGGPRRGGVSFVCGGGGAGTTPPAPGALGRGRFYYVCGGVDADTSHPDPDAWCDTAVDRTIVPDVAVAAPFRIAIDQDSSGGPQPAVPALAQSTPQGWALVQAGWLGFIASSGADVIDFFHVRAQPVASLAYQEPGPKVVDGTPTLFAVVPRDGTGATLGGAIACVFSASDPAVLAVTSTGRVASAVGLATGDVTLTASCAGQHVQTSLHVDFPMAPLDASDDDGAQASPSDGAFDATGDGALDGDTDVSVDGEPDGFSNALPGDGGEN